jgi:hypothetical protein
VGDSSTLEDSGRTAQTLIEQYTGSGWSIVSSPNPSGSQQSALNDVTCVSVSDCWAVGYSDDAVVQFLGATGSSQTLIEQYTGSGWSIVSSPNPPGSQWSQLTGVTCATADDCWAVGDSGTANGTVIEQDAGSGWTVVSSPPAPSGSVNSQLAAVTCVTVNDCWAVGDSNPADSGTQSLIEQNAGSGWSIVSSPDPSGSLFSQLTGVACVTADECWAVGYSSAYNASSQTLIEEDTGGGWTIVSSPTPAGATSTQVEGVACTSSGDCWAVGGPAPEWGSGVTLIEHAYQPVA